MRIRTPFLLVISAAAVVFSASPRAVADGTLWHGPFTYHLEVSPLLVVPGNVTLTLTVRANEPCQSVTLSVLTTDQLTCSDPATMSAFCTQGDSVKFALHLNIPSMDTCGIRVQIKAGDFSEKPEYWWAPRDGGLELKGGDLRAYAKMLYPKPRIITSQQVSPLTDSLVNAKESNPPSVTTADSALPPPVPDKRQAEQDSLMTARRGDTTIIWIQDSLGYSIPVAKELFKAGTPQRRHYDEMQHRYSLEKTPLSNANVQDIIIDGQIWTRKKGETRFHLAKFVVPGAKIDMPLPPGLDTTVFTLRFDSLTVHQRDSLVIAFGVNAREDSTGHLIVTAKWPVVELLKEAHFLYTIIAENGKARPGIPRVGEKKSH